MRGWGGLLGAVANRCRSDWPVVLAAWLLLACATTLLSAGVLYSDTVARGGLREAVLSAPPEDRAVVVRRSAAPDEIETLDALVRPELQRTIRGTGGETALVVRSGTLADTGVATDEVAELTLLASYEGIDAHADLVGGRWPEPGRDPLEATLSEGAADAMGLAIGDRLALVSRLDPDVTLEVTITGLWRPDPADPYWVGDPLELTGSQAGADFATRGPLVVARDDVVTRTQSRTYDVQWRAIPRIEGLQVADSDALAKDIAALQPRLAAILEGDRATSVTAALPGILDAVGRSVLVSRSGVLLLTAQFAVLAGYAVFLVAGLLIERRRAETALLRSRGATSAHLVTMAVLEALLIALPAALVAPVLAAGLVALLGRVGPLAEAGVVGSVDVGFATFLAAAGAAAVGVVALTLPSLLATGNLAGVRAAIGRQAGSTLPQRLGIDLVLIVVAVLALWQLRLYGAPLTRDARGALGIDPLLIAAPAIGLLAGAVVAIRIIPRAAELGERLLVRRRGLVSPLGARQLARRPLRYTRSALLLMLAIALGTFAFAHAATWTRSQADQAAYRAAADARLIASDYPELPSWALGAAYRGVPGVTAASPVGRQALDVGRALRDGQLLAVDATAAATMTTIPIDGATGDPAALLAEVASRRPAGAAVALPGTPRRLALVVRSDVALPPDQPPPTGPGSTASLRPSVVLIDGDGRLHRVDGTAGPIAGDELLLEVPLSVEVDGVVATPTPPLRIEALELQVTAPAFSFLEGTLVLDDVLVSDDASGSGWTPVALDPGAAEWSWTRVDALGGSGPIAPLSDTPGTITIGSEEKDTTGPVFGSPTDPGATFRLYAGADMLALPAIVSTGFLEATGAAIGDTLAAQTYGRSMSLELVGALDSFPPLDPTVPFAVVDGPTLELTRFTDNGQVSPAQEWWLGIERDREAEAIATLRGSPYSAASIVGRDALTRQLETDPVPLGVIGALGIGALAALVFASIGFIVSATVSTSERLGEFALLQALGLSRRELSAWLSVEHAFLLAAGLLAGTALGLLLAWLVLPFATLTETGAATVPPAVVVIPWEAILPLYLLAGALLAVTVWLVSRALARIPLSGVLRARDG